MNRKDLIGMLSHDWSDDFAQVEYIRYEAVMAVVELHKPCCEDLNELHRGYCVFCSNTKLTQYPCPTIEAIEKALV